MELLFKEFMIVHCLLNICSKKYCINVLKKLIPIKFTYSEVKTIK